MIEAEMRVELLREIIEVVDGGPEDAERVAC